MGELAAMFRLSLPCFSNHLRVLREAGLVTQRQVGLRRIYRLQPAKLRLISAWLNRLGPSTPASSRRT
jgi:DNA-binding transcriptional ArsR family regulator